MVEIVVGVLVAAGFMITRALQSSLVYFVLPSEYARDAESFDGRRIRHVVEVRHPSFLVPDFPALLRRFAVLFDI